MSLVSSSTGSCTGNQFADVAHRDFLFAPHTPKCGPSATSPPARLPRRHLTATPALPHIPPLRCCPKFLPAVSPGRHPRTDANHLFSCCTLLVTSATREATKASSPLPVSLTRGPTKNNFCCSFCLASYRTLCFSRPLLSSPSAHTRHCIDCEERQQTFWPLSYRNADVDKLFETIP